MKRILRIFLKSIAWLVATVIGLIVLLLITLQIPAVQTRIGQKAAATLEDKIGTPVRLDAVRIGFPEHVSVKGFYIEDQQGDTLVYVRNLAIGTDLTTMLDQNITLDHITLDGLVANVHRTRLDTAFNFSYILAAFSDTTSVDTVQQEGGWDVTLNTLLLKNIRVSFHDYRGGNVADLALGQFTIAMDTFDINNSIFMASEANLENTSLRFEQRPPVVDEPPDQSTDGGMPKLGLDVLTLADISIDFHQVASGQRMWLDVGNASIEANALDISQNRIDLRLVQVENTFIALHQHSSETPVDTLSEAEMATSAPWEIAVDVVDLRGNSVQYYDLTQPAVPKGIDFARLWITGLDLKAQSIAYSPSGMAATLERLAFREKSGFQLRSMKGRIDIAEERATVEDFLLETNGSRFSARISARYPSWQQIADDWPGTTLDGSVNSDIAMSDLLYFQPSLRDSLPVRLADNLPLKVEAHIHGALNNFTLSSLRIDALSETRVRASGTVKGLPDTEALVLDVALNTLSTTREDLKALLTDTLLPDSINIPQRMRLQASYKGSLQRSAITALFSSDVGSLGLSGNINLDSLSGSPGLKGRLETEDLNIGYILGMPDSVMRTLSITAEADLKGHAIGSMAGTFSATVHDFFYNQYTYSDLSIDGMLENRVLNMHAGMEDENLTFATEAIYDFSSDIPRYGLNLDLGNINFQALHFSREPIRARGQLMADLATADFRIVNGNAGARKVAVFNGDELYTIDSLLFASIDEVGRSEININSDLLNVEFRGSFNVMEWPAALRQYIHTYYNLHDTLDVQDAAPQHFDFVVELRNTDLLTDLLIPELKELVPGKISGTFDSEAKELKLDLALDRIQYGNIGIDSLRITTDSNDSTLEFELAVDRIMIDSTRIDGLQLLATLGNDSMNTRLIVFDSLEQDKYVLAGAFLSRDVGFDLVLSSEGIVLNYLPWTVPPDNYIRFGQPKLIAENVELSHEEEKISLRSTADPASPISIGFRQLRLQHFGGVVAETDLIAGVLGGNIHLYPDKGQGNAFTADVGIDGLAIRGAAWGDLLLEVRQSVNNRFDVDFSLEGDANDIGITGYYQAGDNISLALTAAVERFALATLQPLVADQIEKLEGVFAGDIRITGSPQQPDLDGFLRFSDVAFFSVMLNTGFSLNDERISFIEEGIAFDGFKIVDERRNEARIDGVILTQNYRDFRFSLDVNVSDFRLLNTKEGDNELFYGLVDLDAYARIRGDLATPVIDMDVGLSEGSTLTYIVPQAEAAVLQTEGIVKFVDKTFEDDPFMQRVEGEVSDTVKSAFTGIDLTARIELEGEETFTAVIDPVTGDQLTVKGKANLTLKIDPTGDINLAGRYEIDEGTYNFTFYKFVKREFQIEPGSSITWMGDPLNAQMDIRAIFNVETAPIDLLANQLTGADQNQVNTYRQRMPFMVYLDLSGELLQPEIAFELDMPPDDRGAFNGLVYARLQDINTRESDLNKQVFALLILKRFISDDPFESQGGGGLQSTARRSVSKVLSDQLNRLSQNIKGVELSFDIKSYEDYSGGTAEGQTELELGVSKSLFNDRLVVKLSGNVDLEGRNSNRQATDYIGDLALEYKVTRDGRLRITGFRNSNYDMIDGELIETGAGLIYIKDYNALRELFRANASKKD